MMTTRHLLREYDEIKQGWTEGSLPESVWYCLSCRLAMYASVSDTDTDSDREKYESVSEKEERRYRTHTRTIERRHASYIKHNYFQAWIVRMKERMVEKKLCYYRSLNQFHVDPFRKDDESQFVLYYNDRYVHPTPMAEVISIVCDTVRTYLDAIDAMVIWPDASTYVSSLSLVRFIELFVTYWSDSSMVRHLYLDSMRIRMRFVLPSEELVLSFYFCKKDGRL